MNIRAHPWIQTALLVLGVGIVFCALGELGLRFFTSFDPVDTDPVLGFRARTGAEGWDTNGYRDRVALATSTIVALGDSQTYGNNATIDEAWPQQLGLIATTSVYQMAIPGYGPVQYAALLDDALRREPKAVIVGLYLGTNITQAYYLAYTNDHWKALRNPDFDLQSAVETATSSINYRLVLQTGLEPDSLAYRLYELRLWLRAHSLLYARLGDLTRTFREQIGVAKTLDQKLDDVASFANTHPDLAYVVKTPNISTVLSPSHFLETTDLSLPQVQEGWRITQGLFTQMNERARQTDARLVILAIPTKEESYLHLFEKNGAVPKEFLQYQSKIAELNTALKTFCSHQRIDCIFVTDPLASALARGEHVYGDTSNVHPTPLGYSIIARAVADNLEAIGLIPKN